jgi:hypothetical protein
MQSGLYPTFSMCASLSNSSQFKLCDCHQIGINIRPAESSKEKEFTDWRRLRGITLTLPLTEYMIQWIDWYEYESVRLGVICYYLVRKFPNDSIIKCNGFISRDILVYLSRGWFVPNAETYAGYSSDKLRSMIDDDKARYEPLLSWGNTGSGQRLLSIAKSGHLRTTHIQTFSKSINLMLALIRNVLTDQSSYAGTPTQSKHSSTIGQPAHCNIYQPFAAQYNSSPSAAQSNSRSSATQYNSRSSAAQYNSRSSAEQYYPQSSAEQYNPPSSAAQYNYRSPSAEQSNSRSSAEQYNPPSSAAQSNSTSSAVKYNSRSPSAAQSNSGSSAAQSNSRSSAVQYNSRSPSATQSNYRPSTPKHRA